MGNYKILFFAVLDIFKSVQLTNLPAVVAQTATYMVDLEDTAKALKRAYDEDRDIDFIKVELARQTEVLQSQVGALIIAGGQASQDIISKIVDLIESFVRKVNN